MGDWISFIAGVFLFCISYMVMKAYWPRRRPVWDAAWFLGVAIFIGFVATAANTLWWQVLVGTNRHYGFFDRQAVQAVGLYLDGLLKGAAALSGVLHLIAVHRKLPLPERSMYSWYDMPWYPRRWSSDGWWRKETDT